MPGAPAWPKYGEDDADGSIAPASLHAVPFLAEAEGDESSPESKPSRSSLRGLHPENCSWSISR